MQFDATRVLLLKLLRQNKTDLKNASIAIGRNPAYLHQFVYRGAPKVLPRDVRQSLAKLLHVREDQLQHSVIPPRRPRSAASVQFPGLGGAGSRFVEIREIDVRASAGSGAVNEGLEDAKDTWFFPDTLVRHELHAQPENLRIITIDGDSMEPLLSSGDRILVDTSQRAPVPPGIFVIWDGMGLVAKRTEHIPNSEPPRVILTSVNPQYPTYERIAEEVTIVGRVIWATRRL